MKTTAYTTVKHQPRCDTGHDTVATHVVYTRGKRRVGEFCHDCAKRELRRLHADERARS